MIFKSTKFSTNVPNIKKLRSLFGQWYLSLNAQPYIQILAYFEVKCNFGNGIFSGNLKSV